MAVTEWRVAQNITISGSGADWTNLNATSLRGNDGNVASASGAFIDTKFNNMFYFAWDLYASAIAGVEVQFNATLTAADTFIVLVSRAGPANALKSQTVSSSGVATLGGPVDLWNLTGVNQLTVADINSTNFGAYCYFERSASNVNGSLDYFWMRLYYVPVGVISSIPVGGRGSC